MRRVMLASATIALVTASCSSGSGSAADRRDVAVYSAVIRTVIAQPPKLRQGPPVGQVWVVAADRRSPISLAVQAGIVEDLYRLATIRFVDERAAAIDDATPSQLVRDNGVLIALGPIPPGPRRVTVRAQRYESAAAHPVYRIRLRHVGSTWETVAADVVAAWPTRATLAPPREGTLRLGRCPGPSRARDPGWISSY